ncbi:hypothetical protein PybrP1_009638 [[Pythium] brassicae (nom. inval.)]|nr:hypothetical protein PybrP1_009638 [[Pythium] brassicae (nom. inval.)]
MEKYSRWSDLSTGINPFVPQQQQRVRGSLANKALALLSGAALVLVRAPLVLVLGAVLLVANVLTSVLALVPLLGRLVKRLVDWLLCSLLLLVLGVFVSEEEANARRLGLVTPGAKVKASDSIGAGDLVVCNHTSFAEVLYLARRFSPAFAFVHADGAAKGLVHVCGLVEALYRSFALPVAHDRSTPRKLEDVLLRASGPVVIFPEGARSNGKSVLQFLPVLEQLPHELKRRGRKAPLRVHLLAFRFEAGSGFSPSQSAGGGWRHVFWTAFHAYHALRVTTLHAKDLNLQEPAAKTRAGGSAPATLTAAQVARLRGLLAAMLRTKTVELGVADFVSFNAYWAHVTGGGRKAAAEFTDRKAPHEHAQWSTKTR